MYSNQEHESEELCAENLSHLSSGAHRKHKICTYSNSQPWRRGSFVCEAVRNVEVPSLPEKYFDLVKASAKDPVLRSYSSDATSWKCHVQVRASVSAKTVVREGKDLTDIFTAKSFCEIRRIASSGKESIALSLRIPFRWSTAMALGNVSRLVACFYHCCDGLVPDLCMSITRFLTGLKRMLQHRFELSHDSQAQGDEPKESNLEHLLEWFLSTGCSTHDIQILAQGLIDMHILVES